MDIRQVTETIAMIEEQNFDIRTITMGISLLDCIDPDINRAAEKIYQDEYFTMMAIVSSDEKQDFTYLRNEFEAFGQTLNVKINIQSAAIFEAMYNI
ncbi:ACT domain-containing protein [Streptococcus pneumoniae]|nr:ACT domain-containing protein [Streptococcus pneumoniae]VQK28738.1 ACT domain-containing protein [Streptococcus pneumoniae]